MLRILDRIYLGAASAGSGGGSVDESRIIVKSATIPTAGENYLGSVYMYVGETNSTYTHGYIYECKQQETNTITFTPATMSVSGTDFMAFLASISTDEDYESVVKGTFTYDLAGDLWRFVGKDVEDNTILTYQQYTQDFEDAGFTMPVDSQDGDVVEFVRATSYTYAWERIDVQPGATRGRFLALWNCATGLAESNPPSSPYPYGAGDYYIVGTVGTTNYKPSGSSYVIGTASTTVETDDVSVNDTYYYDGTNWNLQKNTATTYTAGTGISISNGTISVASPTLTNTSTGSGSLTISGTSASDASATNVGVSSSASGSFGSSFGWGSSASGNYSTAVGSQSTAYFYSAAFGYGSTASSQNTTAIGPASTASAYDAIALGHNAKATKESAIQIGNGTNSEDKTMYVGALINNTNHNYKLLDLTTGKIPADRLPSTAPSIDNTTITENASNQLQASAVMNARTGTDVLPIWQGTQQQWTEGVGTDWYNWKSDVNIVAAQSTNPDSSWYANGGQAYGNGIFIKGGYSSSDKKYLYSSDNGESWIFKEFPTAGFGYYNYSIAFGNGVFVTTNTSASKILLSVDGINWTEYTGPGGGNYPKIFYANEYFFLCGYRYFKKSRDGINWEDVSLPSTSDWRNYVVYGNGIYVIYMDAGKGCYTSDDFQTFNTFTISTSIRGGTMAFCNGVFILQIGSSDTALRYVYRSTNGYSWTSVVFKNATPGVNVNKVIVAKDTFFIFSGESNLYYYSKNGLNWQQGSLLQSTGMGRACAGDSTICVDSKLQYLQLSQSQCYTLEAEPTTASTVYSAPNTASALTITSIGTGTITLSDNNTYTYNQSGDEVTYQSIGEAHPTWLCNINGVGVKVGTTMIADNTDTSGLQTTTNLVTSVSSSSTDTQYPSAKLFYDTCGDIETLINAL